MASLHANPVEAVLPGLELAVQADDVGHLDADIGARRAVAVMFAGMQFAAIAGDAHAERRIVIEAMLETDFETKEAQIDVPRLGDVEDAGSG